MNMTKYMNYTQPMEITRNRLKKAENKAKDEEYHRYMYMYGRIMWARNGKLPQAALKGSFMQQKGTNLCVNELTEGKIMLKELNDLDIPLTFGKRKYKMMRIDVCTFSEASFNIF